MTTQIKTSNITDGAITGNLLSATAIVDSLGFTPANANNVISADNYARDKANGAYDQANTATNNAASASSYANTGINLAQSSFNQGNSTATVANTAVNNAASASLYANTGINNAASASAYANAGITLAQASFNQANTTQTFVVSSVNFSTGKGNAISISGASGAAAVYLNTLTSGSLLAMRLTNSSSGKIYNGYFTLSSTASGGYATVSSWTPFVSGGNNPITDGASFTDSTSPEIYTDIYLARNSRVNDVTGLAQAAFNAANSTATVANTAVNNAASASLYANTGINNAASASAYANAGITLAQASFNQANTTQTFAVGGLFTEVAYVVSKGSSLQFGSATGALSNYLSTLTSGSLLAMRLTNSSSGKIYNGYFTLSSTPTGGGFATVSSWTPFVSGGNNPITDGATFTDSTTAEVYTDIRLARNSRLNDVTGLAQAAFNAANSTATVANTDFTTISVTAATYGNATSIPSITLTANGRISSITNTAISIPAGTSITGTANQVIASASTGEVTLSLPQSIGTTNSVQFGSLGVGTGASANTGEIRATNDITAFYSDDRLKTKLGNIENALEKLTTLSGFYYEPNQTAQNLGYEVKRHVGVSAQDVQAVMPEVVKPAPISDQYLTVQYEKLIPLLIEAIKELKAEVDELKGK
jgi:uncharacterized membrane protein YebE (DUF533 family)